jgi:hypothetical protein
MASIEDIVPSCGGDKDIFAVREDGTLEQFETERVESFLLTCPFHENYFLMGRREIVMERVGDLLRKSA